MKRHVTSLLVATLCAVFAWACEQQGPTSPSALGTPGGVNLDAADGVSQDAAGRVTSLAVDCVAKPNHRKCPGGGGGGGGKGSAPIATLSGAMMSGGNGFALTFFKESDTNLEANSDSKSPVQVTTAFNTTNCKLDPPPPPSAPEGIEDRLMAELTDTQEIFALTIGVDKTGAMTGGIGLHYRDTDADADWPLGLGLITLKVQGSATIRDDGNDGNIESYTITGGTVMVHWREPKGKDRVSLACVNQNPVTVNIGEVS